MLTQLFAPVPRGSLLAGAPKVQVRPELLLCGVGRQEDTHGGHLALCVLPPQEALFSKCSFHAIGSRECFYFA